MNNLEFSQTDFNFSREEIERQLERIFQNPLFSESEILKKFLHFIVTEALLGRSNCLKEYTIAINVLEKPLNFKPQDNGIVRIHAGRLRRALDQYYLGTGANDQVVISIPKGKYVPVFNDREDQFRNEILDEDSKTRESDSRQEETKSIAILPFHSLTKDPYHGFAEGVCLQLGTVLMGLSKLSVIAYGALKRFTDGDIDFQNLGATIHADYFITGYTQFAKGTVRINLRIIDSKTCKQLWSESIEKKLNQANSFEVQDDICKYTSAKVEQICGGIKHNKVNTLLPLLSAI